MRTIATSTVAMTAYNLLATGSGAKTLHELAFAILAWSAKCHVDVPVEQFDSAVAELDRRGFIRLAGPPGSGLVDVVDQQRRPVIERDRDDEGQSDPGWRGWRVHARPVSAPQLVRLEDVIR